LVSSLTVLGLIASLVGTATPVAYRAIFGGPWKISRDSILEEFMGFLLALMITLPTGLLIGLVEITVLGSSIDETTGLLLFLGPTFASGLFGGWAWVKVFKHPPRTSHTPGH
jgi:hypothetical protein